MWVGVAADVEVPQKGVPHLYPVDRSYRRPAKLSITASWGEGKHYYGECKPMRA